MTTSLRPFASAAFGIALLTTAAQAQISPFRNSRNSPKLNSEDMRVLNDSVSRLNASASPHAGQSESWSNPQTGRSGTNTIERVFRSGGMPCHALRMSARGQGQDRPRVFHLTYCRTADGDWKIKS